MNLRIIIMLAGLLTCSLHAWSTYWENAVKVTGDAPDMDFSENTQGCLAVDASGVVHLVYSRPDPTQPPPNEGIYYVRIVNGVPDPPLRVDSNSISATNPTLAVDQAGTVHVVWQDSRHGTPQGNWIDNLEIYYDRKPQAGNFFDEDIRLTRTQAAQLEFLSALPRVAQDDRSLIGIGAQIIGIHRKVGDVITGLPFLRVRIVPDLV